MSSHKFSFKHSAGNSSNARSAPRRWSGAERASACLSVFRSDRVRRFYDSICTFFCFSSIGDLVCDPAKRERKKRPTAATCACESGLTSLSALAFSISPLFARAFALLIHKFMFMVCRQRRHSSTLPTSSRKSAERATKKANTEQKQMSTSK